MYNNDQTSFNSYGTLFIPICINANALILHELEFRMAPLPPMAEKALQDYRVRQDILE